MTDSVYFIAAANCLMPIGKSPHVSQRFHTLRTQSPVELRLFYAMDCNGNAHKVEREFHEQFAEKRHRGEWFKLTKEDKKTILFFDSDLTEDEIPCPDCLQYVKGERGLLSHHNFCQQYIERENAEVRLNLSLSTPEPMPPDLK